MSNLKITITLNVPAGTEVRDVTTEVISDGIEPAEQRQQATPHAAKVAERIATAPAEYQNLLNDFVGRCEQELDCAVEIPPAKRTDYLNMYLKSGRRARVASFMVRESEQLRGPRAEIYCDPAHAPSHPPAEPDLHNGRPVQVKVYLGDPGAIDAAVALVRIAIAEHR